ncbi:BON domain-containing protein [Noviherbaspirillum cavernae]|uniref:BON domain-containing protein n=1 Tax=Noviherbaspirillum cavernae TaxID=2320862 RepID=A0A418WVJ6_9BURK|nr:cytidylate kinase family protein [Noviherbaspirillum cavernae]RJF96673.1 BON domain-containing protein [Noviherbaspirillum cavernae]
MPVIAMTQEMGSLAKDVALKLASALDIEVMRNEVVDHVSAKMALPKSAVRRLREGKAGFLERLKTDRKIMALYTAEEVFELANRGNVVLRGWGATCLLRPVPHVPCVRITSSFEKRVEWLMSSLETEDRDFAASEIRRSDEAHASRMHQQFGVSWGDPVLYDMVLNTDRVSVDSCVEQIILLSRRPEFQETEESRAVLANMTLEARIHAAIKDNAATRDTHITVEARNGEVALLGIVLDAQERARTEQVVTEVPGVAGVDNQLRLMTSQKQFMSAKHHIPRDA